MNKYQKISDAIKEVTDENLSLPVACIDLHAGSSVLHASLAVRVASIFLPNITEVAVKLVPGLRLKIATLGRGLALLNNQALGDVYSCGGSDGLTVLPFNSYDENLTAQDYFNGAKVSIQLYFPPYTKKAYVRKRHYR